LAYPVGLWFSLDQFFWGWPFQHALAFRVSDVTTDYHVEYFLLAMVATSLGLLSEN